MRLAPDDDAPACPATFKPMDCGWSSPSLRWDDADACLFLGQVVNAGSTPVSSLPLRKPRWLLEPTAVAQPNVAVK